MSPIRVLVVDDSLTVRKHLCDLLMSSQGFELAGEASNGKQAIELCAALRPDVVTLDMAMPVMSGLAATEYIMAHCPTPILILSASTNRGELFKTYDALAAGALDVLEKPGNGESLPNWEAQLLSTLRVLSRVKVITHPRGKLTPCLGALEPATSVAHHKVMAIGASTGGPAALVRVLETMPATIGVPILIVQHLSAPFAEALAEWLDGQSPHTVRFARDQQPLTSSGVWLAPAGQHLVVQGAQLRLSNAAERHSCRPSVDVLFESLALACGRTAVACLLTGMGRDGAEGLLRIRQAGGHTIAQDEASSVIYGMPREAALLGAASQILPLSKIGAALAEAVA